MIEPSQNSQKPILSLTALGLGMVSLALSLGVHFLSFVSLPGVQVPKSRTLDAKKPLKKGFVRFSLPKPIPQDKAAPNSKKIVEVVQEKTKALPDPKLARLGAVTHKAKNERKVKRVEQSRALDPAKQGGGQKKEVLAKKAIAGKRTEKQAQIIRVPRRSLAVIAAGRSKVAVPTMKKTYQEFLAGSADLLRQQMKAGYQDHIEEEMEEGRTIDLNTQEYRYIGYFTNLRKSIELTWTYPEKAWRSGLDGDVFLKFTIAKSGTVSKIKILNSSGHRVLDDAVVNAVEGAAPFAPLPQAFGKKIKIKGNFTYTLH